MISDNEQLAGLCAVMAAQPAIGLDTEFLRERTYFAQLCLLQLGLADGPVCVDTLALDSLAPLAVVMGSATTCKVVHAARQDLEVLGPAVGPITPVFDTQVAAALAGMPAQVGYAQLCHELLAVTLAKEQTRTDWSRRPLSAGQIEYALDDARYLLPLRERLIATLQQLGRLAWFEEEMAQFDASASFAVEPDQAWRRLRGLSDLDPVRQRVAQVLAAWRERRAVEADRPRGWILPDTALREMVLQVPRDSADLARIPDLPEGTRHRSGAQLLALIAAEQPPARLPELPPRRRPDPAHVEAVRRLAEVTQRVSRDLRLAPELLATRRDLERLVGGKRDGAPLRGWRRGVIGEELLQAL